MDFIKIFILSGILLGGSYAMAHSGEPGRNLGVVGAVYAIAEPDSMTEIENRAKEVDWKKYFNEKKMKQAAAAYRPAGLRHLPRTITSRVYTADMTYTLERDIPDGKGGILYPRGYTFNPLQYLSLPNTLVLIDADDADQVAWFRASAYANDPKVILLLTGGSYPAMLETLKRPVYYANANLIDRLDVRATPAIALQRDKLMEVREIAILSKK